MIFPKDEGVGDWKSGKFELGRAPLWEKCFFIFLGIKTPKWPPFPHAAVFQLPSRIGMNKPFFGNQLGIHS